MAQWEDITRKSSSLDLYQNLKAKIHRKLIERLDFSNVDLIEKDLLNREITRIVENLITEEKAPLSATERESLIVDILHETFALGPIEPLLYDPDISLYKLGHIY